MKYILLLLSFPVATYAQFNKSDIEDLKADLSNYAASGCANTQYAQSATSIMGKLSSPISNSLTPEQAKANDQLREALSGVRDGLMAGMLGNKATCPQKIRDGIKKLDTLPIKSSPGQAPAKEPAGGSSK